MSCVTILATIIGGVLSLLGSILALYYQNKLQEKRFIYEQNKASEEWKRLEERRKEERNFELKRQAYQNYLAVIAQSTRNPINPMEFKATLALLELCGSGEVSHLASQYAKLIESCRELNGAMKVDENTRSVSDQLAAAILSDFRSHLD